MTYQQHPLSAAFPAMTADERQELKDSIEVIGVQNPITIFEGMVLDGWHRYSIADELMMDCPSVELAEWIDPRQFVMAQNKVRRHITAAQIALATVAVYEWAPLGFNQHEKVDIKCPPPKTNAEMADVAGVHPNTIKQAKYVQQNATKAVQEAVQKGEIGLPKAAKIAKLPKVRQEAALKMGVWEEQQASGAPGRTRTETSVEGTEAYESSAHSGEPDLSPAAAPVFESGACGPSAEELAAEAAAVEADMKSIQALLDADDKLATAHAEIKRLNLLVAQMQQRIHGLMTEKTEAIAKWKGLERQLNKLKKVAA